MFATIMRSMLGVQIQFVSNHTKAFLVSSISKCSVFATSIRINIVEQVQTSKFLSLFIFSLNQMTNLRVNWNHTICTGICFDTASESPVFQIHISELTDIGGKVSKFYCPVCRKDRYITWSDLRKKIIYEGSQE
nr:MAG TPA: hypothetical protein [Caudoviricetes sp.]